MNQYIGLDVSLKDTAISIREDGKRIWRGKCPSDPNLLAQMIRKKAPRAQRVVFETGPLSTWFYHALTSEGLPAICIEARHAQKVLNARFVAWAMRSMDGALNVLGKVLVPCKAPRGAPLTRAEGRERHRRRRRRGGPAPASVPQS